MNVNGHLRDKDVFLLGSGTSLRNFDFTKLHNKYVIAINHSIEHYNAQALIFGDKIFVTKTNFDFMKYQGNIFCSDKCLGTNPIQDIYREGKRRIYVFKDRRDEPSTSFKSGLFHPTSTGALAINLALVSGARTIYLLGYDFYYNKGIHFYQDYEHHKRMPEERMKLKIQRFAWFEKYPQIINLNPKSNLPYFKKKSISEVIK
jgi:hypothetical protein